MGSKEIIPRFNVLYFFLLLLIFLIFESDQIKQPNVALEEKTVSATHLSSSADVISRGDETNGKNENKNNASLPEDMDSYLYIQKIIAQEMIPLLFGKYPTSELTFRIEEQPTNFSICGMNRIWKIVLKFESEKDDGPNASTFEEMLDDIFEWHSNISKIEYVFDFTPGKSERDVIDVFLCFNKTIGPIVDREDFNGKDSNGKDFNGEDFIRGILNSEIFPYADGFEPEHKPETQITTRKEMVTDECSSDIYEVNVTDLGGGTCFSSMKTELLLLNLLEKYPQLRGSCLPLDDGFSYNNTLKICMKIARQPKTCSMPKTTEMECCGWKDEATAVIPPGGWPPLQNGSKFSIEGGAPPVGLSHKPYPKELKEEWMKIVPQMKVSMQNKGG